MHVLGEGKRLTKKHIDNDNKEKSGKPKQKEERFNQLYFIYVLGNFPKSSLFRCLQNRKTELAPCLNLEIVKGYKR